MWVESLFIWCTVTCILLSLAIWGGQYNPVHFRLHPAISTHISKHVHAHTISKTMFDRWCRRCDMVLIMNSSSLSILFYTHHSNIRSFFKNWAGSVRYLLEKPNMAFYQWFTRCCKPSVFPFTKVHLHCRLTKIRLPPQGVFDVLDVVMLFLLSMEIIQSCTVDVFCGLPEFLATKLARAFNKYSRLLI